jgi:hypothetical protein
MKKQIVKALSMTVVTLTVVGAMAIVSAQGQTIRRLSAQIPFDFVVGDQTLSAGEYIVSTTGQDGSALRIGNAKASANLIRMSIRVENQRKRTDSRFVFHRYGETYFLAEVWQAGDSTGRALLPTKAERKLKRERASLSQNGYQTVEVVAMLR